MLGRFLGLALALATAGIPVAASAQNVPSTALPGRELDQLRAPQSPQASPGGPTVILPSTEAPEGAAGILIVLRGVTVVGSTVYSPQDLAPLYHDLVGKQVSLQEVYDLAKRITAYYGNHGYVLSRAIVPPQKFARSGAHIRIEVVEGYIDRVVWPEEIKNYRDFFAYYAARITDQRPANVKTIERYLLLAGDLPGLKFNTRLRPSKTHSGAATLVVEVKEKRYDLAARIDNRGSEARGPYQYLASVTANNIVRAHEAFTVTYGGAFQAKELQFIAPSYRQVLTAEGLTLFINGSYATGKPGLPTLELLDYKTTSVTLEGGVSYPVVRTRELSWYLAALMFASDSKGDLLSASFSDDKLRGFRLRSDADWADSLAGINRFTVTFSQGVDGLGSSGNGDPLASLTGGHVDFSKLDGSFIRIQPIGMGFSAAFAVEGQYAFDKLLAPEQCSYGGRTFGRAFDPSALVGDRCISGSAELRYDIPLGGKEKKDDKNAKAEPAPASLYGNLTQVQLYSYLDHGEVHHLSPAAGTPSSEHGSSAGLGVRMSWLENVFVDLSGAKGIDGPRDDWRFFFILTARN